MPLLYLFATISLFIAYVCQRQMLKIRKARDRAYEAIAILLQAAAELPKEINTLPSWQAALRHAAKTWRLTINKDT